MTKSVARDTADALTMRVNRREVVGCMREVGAGTYTSMI